MVVSFLGQYLTLHTPPAVYSYGRKHHNAVWLCKAAVAALVGHSLADSRARRMNGRPGTPCQTAVCQAFSCSYERRSSADQGVSSGAVCLSARRGLLCCLRCCCYPVTLRLTAALPHSLSQFGVTKRKATAAVTAAGWHHDADICNQDCCKQHRKEEHLSPARGARN